MFGRIVKNAMYAKRPSHLILHITNRCNLRCKTCFVDFDKYKTKEITLEEIKFLAKYLNRLVWLDISGGEPFLRKDLLEICASFNTKSISVPTNGFNPKLIYNSIKKNVGKIKADFHVTVSIDGPKKIHDEIRGEGSFSNAIKTVKLLKTINNLKVKVNTVLCEKNYDCLIDFMKYIKTTDVDFHSIIFLRGNPRNATFKLPNYEKLIEIRDKIFEIWDSYDYGLNFIQSRILRKYQKLMYNTSLKVLKEKKQIPKCLADKHHLVVYPDGNVAFCESLEPIGNIRKNTIHEILDSEKANKQRMFISSKKCYCHHNCNLLDNYFLNYKNYPMLIG